MPPTIVQHRSAFTSGSSTCVLAYASNNAAGNLLIYYDGNGGGTGTVAASTDSNGNTIALALNGPLSNSRIDYVASCNAGANTVTAHDASGGKIQLHLWEMDSIAAAPLDQTGSVNSTTGSVSTSGSTAQANEYVFAGFLVTTNNHTLAPDGSASANEQVNNVGGGDCSLTEVAIVASAGVKTLTVTGNAGDTIQQVIATFKISGPPPCNNRIALMGAGCQ